jgi:chaperonin GroES
MSTDLDRPTVHQGLSRERAQGGSSATPPKRPPNQLHFTPLDDKIVVRRLEAPDKSPGGLMLPEVAKTKIPRGEVLAVGAGRTLDNGQRVAVGVNVGDVVAFHPRGGNEIEIGGEALLILAEGELFGVVGK